MKLLKQPTDYTCGQTAVAMVAGVSVDKVRKIMKAGHSKRHWFGEKTSTKDLVRALRILKVRSRRKIHRLKKNEILPYFCIARMQITGQRWSHWVVFKGKEIYDPAWGKNPTDWPAGFHPTSYLEML